ncbi:hypothetical protein VF14_03530 [Nostoc linckia z18]|jgi:hypothetical protein|uniref:Uncharacterized protein n=3 Tax=Nostoc linckia TaxID=92942 RepID=A0A9Q5ZH02_NOSLI|nr:hypothetical protein VF02_01000 [Nostoc linckia z1]PHJ73362.1 hypothetical protein VF05_02015 [Nostoc linckia z3]PHJ78709.1 hypothetical protein VF03_01000 [Nostoc linckia z2]PHJ85813.1 hypothetical protein VF06_06320 [Nostoc linckia z4]PHJ92315.1 hypothetical protein VF07_02305 [Nostoc linckia z6]PHK01319.1 hypothetical protein VF04_01000 [Nostoc linckia z7]PHK07206.1 hypothetical protein VF08_00950 [Nostoc linckia z8]PHK12943.1 hypothetical protein VF09_01035 [Nostoc linckia z9]PHK2357
MWQVFKLAARKEGMTNFQQINSSQITWNFIIDEILPSKFHLVMFDSSGRIFWHRRCFTSFEKANRFFQKTCRMIRSYDWLCDAGNELDWYFFDKFFILVSEEFIYKHWAIVITELVGDYHLQLHDPCGSKVELDPISMDEATMSDALKACQLYIDGVETSRYSHPGQLSLFDLEV